MTQSWMHEGMCRTRDPSLWDTDIAIHEVKIRHKSERVISADKRQQLAMGICLHTCPVQPQCLEYALRHPAETSVGIWGGTDPDKRRELRLRERTTL